MPHRERSLEVFGNEKRLDTLMRTRLFTKRLLTLDLLRCFQAPLPLTAQYVGSPDLNPQLLIVENHATYASVLAAARKRIAEGAVGFGVGYGHSLARRRSTIGRRRGPNRRRQDRTRNSRVRDPGQLPHLVVKRAP